MDTSAATEQDDQFPPNLCVKVNAKVVPLPHPIPSNRPGVEPKRPSRPLNITNYVKLSPTTTNNISITWASDNSRGYAMCVYLVKKLSSSDLLARLKQKGARPADYSRGLSTLYKNMFIFIIHFFCTKLNLFNFSFCCT